MSKVAEIEDLLKKRGPLTASEIMKGTSCARGYIYMLASSGRLEKVSAGVYGLPTAKANGAAVKHAAANGTNGHAKSADWRSALESERSALQTKRDAIDARIIAIDAFLERAKTW